MVDTFIYDNDGLLTNAGNYTITRKPSNGLPETVTGNGFSIGRTFNGYGEIDNQSHMVNGLTIASWNVTQRDQTGKILEKSETVSDELGETVTDKYVYAYDNFGRLLTVTKNDTMVEEYAYDELPYGTRTYEMNLNRGINGRTYAYDMEDRLDSISDGTSFTFDADGFLTSKTTAEGTTTYDYSSRGELRSATLPDNTLVEYVHDPIGRRIAKIVNGTIVEKYLWNGRTQLLAVYNADDSLKMRFEYADGRMPVSMTADDGQRYFLACDQVGSLRIVANQSGTVVKRIEYDTFGNIIDDSDPLFEIPFGFAGGLHDWDTGLVRFGFRDYDSDIGRWTAKDPIGFAGGDTDLFGYCFSDPVNWIDPHGLDVYPNDFIGPLQPGDVRRTPPKSFLGSLTYYISNLYGNADHSAVETSVKIFNRIYEAGEVYGMLRGSIKIKGRCADWSRGPKSVQDKMALQEAMKGKGEKIKDGLNDSRFKGMEKWEFKIKSTEGKDTVVHYVRDPKTGNLMDFKFKKHSTGDVFTVE